MSASLSGSLESLSDPFEDKLFSNENKLFSYAGLTPREYSSGEHVRQGHITRQGKSLKRRILVEAAWIAIIKDHHLQQLSKKWLIVLVKKEQL
ncbi:MAG: IS110 family transposase [Parachlamydiaceae bacterium]|nr:IS110 family transposase [Parachlamydiaceae bacterium]